MADKTSTVNPSGTASNKRDPTSSPADAPSPKEIRIGSSPAADSADELLEVDDGDSAFGDGSSSDGTSVRSSTLRGYVENGRRYATLRGDGEVVFPSDDKQFEVFETTHLMLLILDSQRRNTLFQSPISEKAQYALDIGTGDASWAVDVADRFPNLTVYGVDLHPPPRSWVPPNCILEVDDITKPWTYHKKFDLINMRMMMGSFSIEEWKNVHRQAYDNLQPGGWIEQVEIGTQFYADDDSLPADSLLAKFHEVVHGCADKANKPMDIYHTFEQSIEEAGFINLHKTDYKVPVGEWPRLQVYKDAGRVCKKAMKDGLEGWLMWFLTKWGSPTPWSPEEVQVYLAELRSELDKNWHMYQKAKRVWAQKPYDAVEKHDEPIVENVASLSG